MRTVIDTNCLLNSVPRNGSGRWLYDAYEAGEFTWVFSNEILSEYAELVESEFSTNTAELVMGLLLLIPNHLRFEPSFRLNLIVGDPDDNKFVDCAIGANVDYLVSRDQHILNLRRRKQLFPPVPIVSLTEFKRILNR